MSTSTTNYKLKKPSADDFYNVNDQNENMEIIDVELKRNADELTTHVATDATTSKKGHVQLSDATNSTSIILAATANAVKKVWDLATSKYLKPVSGIPKSDFDNTVQTSLGKADSALQTVADASTTVKGISMLSNGISGTSQTKAATELAVKDAKEAAMNPFLTAAPNGSAIPSTYPAGYSVAAIGTSQTGFPQAYGTLHTYKTSDGTRVTQSFYTHGGSQVYTRQKQATDTWSAWEEQETTSGAQAKVNNHATNKLNPHEVTTKQVNMIVANSKTNADPATGYPEGVTAMQVSVLANGFPSQYGVLTTTRIGSFAQQEFSLAAGTFIYNRIWNPNSSVWSAWETSETTTGAQAKATAIQDWAKGVGLGGIAKNVNNFDNLGLETGFYMSVEGSTNVPLAEFGTVLHIVRNGSSITQTFTGSVTGRVFVRAKSSNLGWTAWKELATKNDVLTGLMGGKVTDKIVENFDGKIAGNNSPVPHIAYGKHAQQGLLVPTDPGKLELDATRYGQISKLDGSVGAIGVGVTTSGNVGQIFFTFNVLAAVERKVGTIPGTTTAEKVAWLRLNITKLTVNWHGFGSGPLGSKATVSAFRYDNNQWYAPNVHTSSAVSKITRALVAQADLNVVIDNGGFTHFLAYAEPSNGVVASVINTDHIDLEIELAISGPNATIDTHVKDALIHRKISIQATAPTNPQENDIWIEV